MRKNPYQRFSKQSVPELPKTMCPLFYSENKKSGTIYIFAIDKQKNYTITWDGYSKFPNVIQSHEKKEDDLYEIQRLKI